MSRVLILFILVVSGYLALGYRVNQEPITFLATVTHCFVASSELGKPDLFSTTSFNAMGQKRILFRDLSPNSPYAYTCGIVDGFLEAKAIPASSLMIVNMYKNIIGN